MLIYDVCTVHCRIKKKMTNCCVYCTGGYSDVRDGIRLMARGFNKVQAVLAKRPNFQNLHKVFQQLMPAVPNAPDQCQVAVYSPPPNATPRAPVISKAKIGQQETVLHQVFIQGVYNQPKQVTDKMMKSLF